MSTKAFIHNARGCAFMYIKPVIHGCSMTVWCKRLDASTPYSFPLRPGLLPPCRQCTPGSANQTRGDCHVSSPQSTTPWPVPNPRPAANPQPTNLVAFMYMKPLIRDTGTSPLCTEEHPYANVGQWPYVHEGLHTAVGQWSDVDADTVPDCRALQMLWGRWSPSFASVRPAVESCGIRYPIRITASGRS